MAITYYARKKSKKKTPKNTSVRWLASALYIFGFAAVAWLFAMLWFGIAQGEISQNFLRTVNQFFGQSAPLIPVLLTYWLVRSLIKKTSAFVFFLFGSLLTLTAFSSVLTMLKLIFSGSQITGGYAGQELFYWFEDFVGPFGASLFSLALLLVGLHMLFAIPWRVVVEKTTEFLRDDFQNWMDARAELKEKVQEGKAQVKRQASITQEPLSADRPQPSGPKIYRPQTEIQVPVAGLVKNLPRSGAQMPNASKPQDENKPAELKPFDPATFVLPSLDLLADPVNNGVVGPTDEEIAEATKRLEETLKNFEIGAHVTGVSPGPVVTRYEIKPDPGVKIASIVSISNDIALAMKAKSIRVEAPIPGKDAIGFEIPNDRPLMVTMKEILQDPVYTHSKARIPIALGRFADGRPAGATLEKWPHILIAGATNSGKSICLHTIIMSVLYHAKPNEVKFLMIDPKRLELTLYEGIPHLYDPKTSCDDVNVVTDAQGAVKSLQMLVKVMEKRLKIMELAKVKNIECYNAWAEKKGEEKMFYIVVVIDEMADLMLQTRAAIEDSVQRLAQMARAVGIHLILCTQRPSVNVITGVIKANLPSRIALQVASKTDSRVILDGAGAELLLGRGDMLYQGTSDQKPHRIQGAYVSEAEITSVADFLRSQGAPDYPVQILADHSMQRPQDGLGTSPEELLQALKLVTERRRVSQDLLKAHFGSSARATNILSVLEMKGFITKPEGSNRWEIHYDLIEEQIQALENRDTDKYKEPEYETVYK